MTIRVALVENHHIVRQGFVSLLGKESGIEVIGEAADGSQGVELVLRERPDITLMDLEMEVMDGIKAIQLIRQQWPDACILVLTNHDDDVHIHHARLAGAQGYLLKNVTLDELLVAIRAICSGQEYLSSEVLLKLMTHSKTVLSTRELEVLSLLGQGLKNQPIATELNIEEGTIKTHMVKIFRKLNVSSRFEAVEIARKRGIIPPAQQ